ncbi:SGNH/GDSL hydrolase family protein [Nocardia niwae]|uniref:SGNH/GDSL hydrolase family protein n=1 Tax=Nocardia niwae TaxID=626084 RepID=A0ABV2X6Y8_9NOCA|nr:SGNH/GDSL hydrolase family protein [Nocardia niwae]
MTLSTFRTNAWIRGAPTALAVLLLAGAATVGGTADAAPPGPGPVYVALGDSFAAGGMDPSASAGFCDRSAENYAHLIARDLQVAELRDVSCGSAKTADFTASRTGRDGSTEPPQYAALDTDVTLVTVGIGGNDIGLAKLAVECFVGGLLGSACEVQGRSGELDDSIARFKPTYGEVIEQVRARAPRADIIMVGYPTVFPPGGCPAVQPLSPTAADYVQDHIEQLNDAMKAEAVAHQARYVDLLESTRDHSMCAPPEQRWVEGPITIESGAVPLHPNTAGHANMARQILAELRSAPR